MRHHFNAAGLERLQRNAAGDAQGCRQAAGEMPATGDIVHVVILHARREVRMSRTGLAAQLGVILGARVGVLDNRSDGRAGGMSIDHTGDDMRGVGLAALGRGLVATGGATVQKGLQLLLIHGNTSGDAVERATDSGGVRLAEDAQVQYVAKGRGHAIPPRAWPCRPADGSGRRNRDRIC